jgi:hypothetical protein
LYDMSGNVWEWCEDLYVEKKPVRVVRGGSWYDRAGHCRVADRSYSWPGYRYDTVGFRLVEDITADEPNPFDDFEKKVEEILEKIRKTLVVKGKEYSRNNDPFHNFNVGSKITGKLQTDVLDGFVLKHYVSYRDILEDLRKGIPVKKETIDEKLGDILVYFVLQKIQMENLIESKE